MPLRTYPRIDASFSARPRGRRFTRRAAVWLLIALLAATNAVRAEPAAGLPDFESRIDDAPGVRALARQIDADVDAEGVAYARSGLNYVFNNGIGPRSDIVIGNLNNNTFRYAQSVGVQLPILGTAFAQTNAQDAARTTEELARIEYQDDRRQVLAKVRDAYVQYWQFDREREIAQRYVDRMERDLGTARALRRSGFWTEGNLLDYLETLARFRTAARNDRTLRRAQLALLSSALGGGVSPFHPLDPTFAAACVPRKADAVASAAAIDPELAKIAADRVEVASELERVRGSAIDARLAADLGTVADLVPARLGYELTAGVAVAFPSHARSEERSLRAQLEAELDAQDLRRAQRDGDIDASIESAIDDLDDARGDLLQATVDETAAREALREAEVRYRTIPGQGATAFDDVESRLAETFTAETATATARAAVFVKLATLLTLAPEACS